MKALIFGASGQDGKYVADACQNRGIVPIGISRTGNGLRGDVVDFPLVESLVNDHHPNVIFHLAARSTTRHEALFENHKTISTGTINILESVYRAKVPAKVFIVGSGVQFLNTGHPISEETPFAATSPYAVARIQSAYAARYYRTLGVHTYIGYLFHHESPLRPPGHVSRDVIDAVARISGGSSELLNIGDLSIQKEWTFAGDIADAILTLLQQETIHEAVIGSGETHSIEEWVQECFTLRGLNWKPHVHCEAGFKAEYLTLASNPSRIKSLGWKPKVTFQALAALMSGF